MFPFDPGGKNIAISSVKTEVSSQFPFDPGGPTYQFPFDPGGSRPSSPILSVLDLTGRPGQSDESLARVAIKENKVNANFEKENYDLERLLRCGATEVSHSWTQQLVRWFCILGLLVRLAADFCCLLVLALGRLPFWSKSEKKRG